VAFIPDPPAGDLPAADRGGDYEVGAVLREGWGGTIREGRYLRTGRRVTVEDIRPDLASTPGLIERLAEAGRALATLRDPHLVAVYDLVGDDAGYHLIAEWCDAPSLAHLLRGGWVSAERGVAVIADVLAGLAVLHQAGLVHGQVGPETVVAGPDGPARLAELGACSAAAPKGAGSADDVRDAARLGLHLLRRSGSRTEPVRALLDAAVGSSPADAGTLRREIETAAAAGLGAGWRDQQTAPPAKRVGKPRRLLIWVLVALVAVAAGTAAGLILLRSGAAGTQSSGPLVVGSDASLTVSPASAACDTTFVFVARGSLSGAGTLVYRWEQSDGEVTSDTALTVRPDEGSFQLIEAWRLQGSQTVNDAMTLHILRPVNRSLRRSFRYVCP
jgi:hypothetical protein